MVKEESAVTGRKQSVVYDKVIQRQRELIYATRDKLLSGGELSRDLILEMAGSNIRRFLLSKKTLERCDLNRYILDHVSYRLEKEAAELSLKDRRAIRRYLMEKVCQVLEEQEKKTGSAERMNEYQNESFASFRKMKNTVYENAMRSILLSDIFVDTEGKLHILFP